MTGIRKTINHVGRMWHQDLPVGGLFWLLQGDVKMVD